MEPLLLSNIPLHFQLKHEAKFPHKNCRATTLYSTKIPKKKKKKPNNGIFFAQIIFLSSPHQISNCFALPTAHICSLPHSKSPSLFFFFFFFLLTHSPYFLSFPIQISNVFPSYPQPKTHRYKLS